MDDLDLKNITKEQWERIRQLLAERSEERRPRVEEKEVSVLHIYTCRLCHHQWERNYLVKVKTRGCSYTNEPVRIKVSYCQKCRENLRSCEKDDLVEKLINLAKGRG